MKSRTFYIRWFFILLAMVLCIPTWAKKGSQEREMREGGVLNTSHYTLWAYGEDVDIFFDEGHDQTFSKEKFKSISYFDNKNGLWCYKFFIEQWNANSDGSDSESRVVSDITMHLFGNDGTDYYMGKIANTSEGDILENHHPTLGSLERGESNGEYLLYVSQSMMQDLGIQGMYLHFRYLVARHDFLHAKDKDYEIKVTKTLAQGLTFTYTPMPINAKFSVTSDGYLKMDVDSVPGHSRECYYDWSARSSSETSWTDTYRMTISQDGTGWTQNKDYNRNVSFTDNKYRFSPKNAYTIRYKGCMKGDRFDFWNPFGDGNWQELSQTIPAYLYPINLEVSEYDQWKNEAKVTWLAQRKYTDASTGREYNRSDNGKWYIYRKSGEEKFQYLTDKVDNGESDGFSYTDHPSEPNTNYTYCVVFVPEAMLEDAKKEFPDSLEVDLKPTISVDTKYNVDMTLTQVNDNTAQGILLRWEYYVPQSGSTFTVLRRTAGSGAWEVIEDNLTVHTDQTSDTYLDKFPANACTAYDYCVRVNTLGTTFDSNIAANCNLLSGTSVDYIEATKGTESNVVTVNWKATQMGTDDTYYNIERRPLIGSITGEWARVGTVHGTEAEYSFADEHAEPGSYYEYRIIAYGQHCADQAVRSSELSDVGFSRAVGAITGHISYGSGNSVDGVTVHLIPSGTDDDVQQHSYARFIHGIVQDSGDETATPVDGGLVWTADSAHYAARLNSSKPLTVQLWAAPMHGRTYMPLFTLGHFAEVGLRYMDETRYSVLFFHGDKFDNLDFYVPASRYSHYTVTYDGAGKWRFIIDGNTGDTRTFEFDGEWQLGDGNTDFHVGGNSVLNPGGQSFCGLVDEVRLWSRQLTDEEVLSNYNRLLSGTENEMVLYWPMDEGLEDHIFDIARQNGVSNQNHPTLSKNTRPSRIVPQKLGIYGKTDADGNYRIEGIPFATGGTNYKLLPDFGVHEFQPSSRSLYISTSSLTANGVDFTDRSSFPMRGYIYYKDTNIPVKGIYLYVDGQLVNSEGKIAETDENGFYEISVPIGQHYVEAKQTGHDLVNGGRWPTRGTYDFQTDVYQNFSDSTLVNFCGRVAGGNIQEDKPVGFGRESGAKNNIGQAVITLAMKNNPNLSFNCEEGTTSDNTGIRSFQSHKMEDTDSICSTTYAGAGNQASTIFIQTDPKTGEFSAMLPPLRYSVTSISIPSNSDIHFADLPDINMTNPISSQVDSLRITDIEADSTHSVTTKLYKYNQKMVSIWYADPTLQVRDDKDSLSIGAFGERCEYNYKDAYGKVDSIVIYKPDGLGGVQYLYDYPVFKQWVEYTFSLEAYEEYVNHDDPANPVSDYVKLSNQVLSISNELSSDQVVISEDAPDDGYKAGDLYEPKSKWIQLDDNGKATYSWIGGIPNPTAPYTRHLGISYERFRRTYYFDIFDAYVFGDMTLGNNFVTKGPDQVMMVLRDPPGSHSYTSWIKGRTQKTIECDTNNGLSIDLGVKVSVTTGIKNVVAVGIGVAAVTMQGASEIVGVGGNISFNVNKDRSITYTFTNTETISTSSDTEYIGANGDVYIGASTNLIIGDCKTVDFFRDGEDKPFVVKDSLCLAIGDTINTSFMYTQAEIENKQIPEWEKLRASIQIPFNSESDARAYTNDGVYPKYVTWKDPYSDEWTPDSTSYLMVMGSNDTLTTDSVLLMTSMIELWKEKIRDNEEDKLISRTNDTNSKEMKNISFDGGTGYKYSSKADTTKVSLVNFKWGAGLKGNGAISLKSAAGAKIGVNLLLNGSIQYNGSATVGSKTENYTHTAEFSYNFSDGNVGSDYSVNCYRSGSDWSDHFSTQAGQTYCPYAGGEVTKYYNPGQVISNATVPMQNPQIRVSNGNQNPSSTSVITDVPAGEAAIFTLYLTSEVETDMAMTYVLGVKDATNPDGLQFIVDGVKFNGGRSIVIKPGETIIKTLEVRQTDLSKLDYNDVTLTLSSDCQKNIASLNGVIADKANISVHFKPSSSPVKLKADAFVVNTGGENKGQLTLTLADFNRSFLNLKSMGVEYKAEGSDGWNNIQQYVFNKADSIAQNDIVVPSTGDVNLILDMSDNNSFPDRTYIFRAYTETEYGTEKVRNYSDEISVVKDMHRPTTIGTPQPADGILHAGDDIVVEFNEDIVPGYVNASNVTVTGKVNSQPTTHEVSLHLSGKEPTAATASDFYMQGNSTVALWLKYTQPGTLFTHCKGDNAFTLNIDEEGHLAVKAGGIDTKTQKILPKDEWMYLAYSYNEGTKALSMVIQHGTVTDSIMASIGSGRTLQQVVYADDKRLFLGGNGLEADMHDLRIYGISRNPLDVATEKYNSTNIYTAGLMAHWPMDEGQGTKARDLRGDSHPLVLTAPNWHIDGTNYAATVDATQQQHLDLNIAAAATDDNESYVVEFWFRADGDMADKTLMQAGTDSNNTLRLFTLADGQLAFEYGINRKLVAPEDFDLTGGWHHFALNVIRGASASIAIDGKRTAVLAESAVPPLEGAKLVLGASFNADLLNGYQYDKYMTGAFDEVRVWRGVLKPEVVQADMYQCLDTLQAGAKGLTVYYPMEANAVQDGVNVKVPSDADWAPGQIFADAKMTGKFDLNAFSLNAPPLRKAPEVKTVVSNATVSDRKVYIQLEPVSLAEIEGTTLDITVSKIFDKNGNSSLPITWPVYVHQNTLNWAKDSVTCIKNYGDDASFQVEIANTGMNTEYYNITGLPTWLTTDYATGEVAPESSQAIRFDVLPTATVGTYDVNLTLTGNNEIAEPLRLVLKVRGVSPDWAVAPDSSLVDQMNMVGQVLIDGIVSENTESLLGAFIGPICVGVAKPEKARGTYYIPMTIYGNAKKHDGETISFKFWDASTGITYVGLKAESVVQFKQDDMRGSYNRPVILTNTDEVEQRLDVLAGWNWISTYVQPDPLLPLTEVIVADGFQQNDILKSKNSVKYYGNDGWNFGSLTTIEPASMYKLYVQGPVSMVIKGKECVPSQTPIKLSPKWNWIGFIPQSAMEINQALGGTGAVEGDYIKSKSEFAIYGPYGWEGNLKTLEPGKGYMYYSQSRDTITFHYPDVTAANRARVKARAQAPDYYFTPVGPENYPDNMSIVLQLLDNGEPVDTFEVAAFIDGQCRATAKADGGLYYLMVQGEGSGQRIQLCTYYEGNVIVIDETQTFRGDTNIGLPWEPYTIDLAKAIATGLQIANFGAEADDAKYFMPNGIQVLSSSLKKGQVYIRVDRNGKATKFVK